MLGGPRRHSWDRSRHRGAVLRLVAASAGVVATVLVAGCVHRDTAPERPVLDTVVDADSVRTALEGYGGPWTVQVRRGGAVEAVRHDRGRTAVSRGGDDEVVHDGTAGRCWVRDRDGWHGAAVPGGPHAVSLAGEVLEVLGRGSKVRDGVVRAKVRYDAQALVVEAADGGDRRHVRISLDDLGVPTGWTSVRTAGGHDEVVTATLRWEADGIELPGRGAARYEAGGGHGNQGRERQGGGCGARPMAAVRLYGGVVHPVTTVPEPMLQLPEVGRETTVFDQGDTPGPR